MGKINSRQKGAAGEREAAAFLNGLGFTARRSVQNGVTDGRDIVVDDLPNVYFEVKRDQSVAIGTRALWLACEQACKKTCSRLGTKWCVLWRRDRECWRMTYQTPEGFIATVYQNDDIAACLRMLNERSER